MIVTLNNLSTVSPWFSLSLFLFVIGRFEAVPTPALRKALNLKAGVVSSGNSLDYTEEDMACMVEHGAAVKEMEAAAVAWAASLFDCPVLCVKSVTDIVDGTKPAADEFLENLHHASDALQQIIPKIINFIGGKKLGEL